MQPTNQHAHETKTRHIQPPSEEERAIKRAQKEEQRKADELIQMENLRKNNLDVARQQLSELLKVAEISKVVYVDDNYSETISSIEKVMAFCSQIDFTQETPTILQTDPLLSRVKFNLPDEVWEADLRKIWESETTSRDEKSRVTRALMAEDELVITVQRESISALDDIFEGQEFIRLSLVKWQELKSTLMEEAVQSRTLFLFDRDFMLEEGDIEDQSLKDRIRNAGFELMKEVCDETAMKPDCALCGLVSYTLDSLNEKDAWEGLWEQHGFDRLRCVPIPRACLGGDTNSDGKRFSEFVRRVKFTVLSLPLHQLVSRTKELFHNAIEEADSKISKISIYALDHILFHKSKYEGLWEPDTLFRIFGLHQYKVAQQMARDVGDFPPLLEKIRPLSNLFSPTEISVMGSVEHKSLGHLENYDEGIHINPHHLPIDIGDLFEVQSESGEILSRWILLDQACDLMIRYSADSSKIGKRNLETLSLVEIKLVDEKISEERKEKIPYYTSTDFKDGYLDWQSQTPIEAWVLDLCAFHDEGTAQFNVDDECPKDVSLAWIGRHQRLREIVTSKLHDFVELRRAIEGTELDSSLKEKALKKLLPSAGVNAPCIAKVSEDGKNITFNLSRNGRLLPPLSSHILATMHRYNSRPSTDMDLGKVK